MSQDDNLHLKFLKNADIRAGKIPGWPGKPETNGDPYDPGNTARTDAAMVVTDGMVMRNAASVNAARAVSFRRAGMIAMTIPFWLIAGGFALEYKGISNPLRGLGLGGTILSIGHTAAEVASGVNGESSRAIERSSDGVLAKELIQKFHGQPGDGIARDYKLDFLVSKMGWPNKKYHQISFSEYTLKQYDEKNAIGAYEESKKQITKICGEQGIEKCIPQLNEEGRYVALLMENENPAFYKTNSGSNDASAVNERNEGILADFRAKFPKTASSYCDSENRLYAETWHSSTAQKKIKEIGDQWEKGAIQFNDQVVKVNSAKEMIKHRIEGDAECKNISATVLEVNKGALQYMLSVSARTHTEKGNHIATGLYLLGKLDDRNVMSIVSCNNCENVPAFSEKTATANAENIIPGLNVAAEGIVNAFKKSGYELKKEEGVK